MVRRRGNCHCQGGPSTPTTAAESSNTAAGEVTSTGTIETIAFEVRKSDDGAIWMAETLAREWCYGKSLAGGPGCHVECPDHISISIIPSVVEDSFPGSANMTGNRATSRV